MKILDMTTFMIDGLITESAFYEKVEQYDWEQFRNQRVLIKGCGTTIIPPWAFMVVASQLAHTAKSVRYGNEHSSVPIFSRLYQEATDAGR